MGKEIVINAQKDQMRIAIVEDGELAEMYFEDANNERTLGDIYLGRVRRIMPSIKAAFIDVGQPSDAFLHFSDIADNIGDLLKLVSMDAPDVSKVDLSPTTRAARRHRPRSPLGAPVSLTNEEDDAEEEAVLENRKPSRPNRSDSGGDGGDFRPESLLKRDQKILVKIVKEPISAKGSRVSTDISLAGRFLVLVPLADYVAVSKKIVSYKERRRLRALATSLLPKGFGVIVRTVAEGKNAKTLDTDLRLLVDKWRRIEKRMTEVKDPPALMHQDVNMVSSVIRDLFSDDYDRILVDDQKVYRNIKGYIQAVAPQMAPAVQFHQDRTPVFKVAKIDRSVSQAFESRVPLPSGGYLIIEHTEAMHVIDVNSGRAGKGLSQEQNSLKVNLEAARMVARQLRVRDLGGIIVVDFIDLRDDKNRRKVHDELRREFSKDRAVTKVLPMSDFGVVQITRQRLRPSITTKKSAADKMKGTPDPTPEIAEPVPSGSDAAQLSRRGRERPSVTPVEMMAKIDKWLSRHKENGGGGPLVLKVHPFARAFLQRGILNATRRWSARYLIRIRLEEDESLDPLVFRIFDPKTNEELTRRRRSGRRRGKSKSADEKRGESRSKRADAKSKDDGDDRRSGKKKDRDNSDGKAESQSDASSGERKSNRRKGDRNSQSQQRKDSSSKGDRRKSSRGRQSNKSQSQEASGDKEQSADSNTNRGSRDRGRNQRQQGKRPSDSDRKQADEGGRHSDNTRGRKQPVDEKQTESPERQQTQAERQQPRDERQQTQAERQQPRDERQQAQAKREQPRDERQQARAERQQPRDERQQAQAKREQPRDERQQRQAEPQRTADQPSGDSTGNGHPGSRPEVEKQPRAEERRGGADSGPKPEHRTQPAERDQQQSASSRPESVVFVSRHEPRSESKQAGTHAEHSQTAPSHAAGETPKAPTKVFSSQHAPRKSVVEPAKSEPGADNAESNG